MRAGRQFADSIRRSVAGSPPATTGARRCSPTAISLALAVAARAIMFPLAVNGNRPYVSGAAVEDQDDFILHNLPRRYRMAA